MYTVKVEDADFVSSYKLKVCENNTFFHTVVTWFDAYFNESHRPIQLSTSPYKRATHWKQTIFFCPETLPVNKGDYVTGSIAVRKDPDNPRFLNTKLSFHLNGSAYKTDLVQYYKFA